jgi:hypothetical protein
MFSCLPELVRLIQNSFSIFFQILNSQSIEFKPQYPLAVVFQRKTEVASKFQVFKKFKPKVSSIKVNRFSA